MSKSLQIIRKKFTPQCEENESGYYRPPQTAHWVDNSISTRLKANMLWPEEAFALQWLYLELHQLFPTGNLQDNGEFRATGTVTLRTVPEEHVPIIMQFLTENGMYPERHYWRNETMKYTLTFISFRPSLTYNGWFDAIYYAT